MVADQFFECSEAVGKTIQNLRVYQHGDGNEVLLEFTDGTSLSCSIETRSRLTASLFRPSAGTPEVIRTYRS